MNNSSCSEAVTALAVLYALATTALAAVILTFVIFVKQEVIAVKVLKRPSFPSSLSHLICKPRKYSLKFLTGVFITEIVSEIPS